MKKTKVILLSSIAAMAILCTAIAASASTVKKEDKSSDIVSSCYSEKEALSDFENFQRDAKEDKIKAEIDASNQRKTLKTNKTAPLSLDNGTNVSDSDLGLDEKFAQFDAAEKEQYKNDLKAYKILSKYSGKQYNRTAMITDYNTDIKYMRAMEKLIDKGSVKADEAKVLQKYIPRRAYWLTDKTMIAEFEKWIID